MKDTINQYFLTFDLKGAGRARVEPHPGFIVDLFVTHTCAVGPSYTNAYYREHQVSYIIYYLNLNHL